MNVFLLLDTKEDILKIMGNQTVDVPHLLKIYIFFLWKSMGHMNCLVIPQNIFLYIQQKKEIN